jgi:hypothetical protein
VFIEYLIAAAGFSSLVKYKFPYKEAFNFSSILREGLDCSLCLGFWAGVAFLTFEYFHYGILSPELPLATSAAAFLFDTVIDLAQTTSNKLDKE